MRNGTNGGNGTRRPEEILAEIHRTRDEMDHTLHEIEHRLTPGQLVDQGLEYLKKSGAREYVNNLSGSVKNHPLPATLTGIGIAWLMAVGNKQPAQAVFLQCKLRPGTMGESHAIRERACFTTRQQRAPAARACARRLGFDAERAPTRARRHRPCHRRGRCRDGAAHGEGGSADGPGARQHAGQGEAGGDGKARADEGRAALVFGVSASSRRASAACNATSATHASCGEGIDSTRRSGHRRRAPFLSASGIATLTPN